VSVLGHLNVLNATIRDLLQAIERKDRDAALRILDELENQIDAMLMDMAPERITDERFEAAMKAITKITERAKHLREAIWEMKFTQARKLALEVQEAIRNAYRLLILIRAGTPTPVIFQVSPQFLRDVNIQAPESLIYTNPMAAQIYNVLVRKGEATLEELAAELGIDEKSRDEFNRAIAHLISLGYVRPYLTPDNKMVLKPAR